MNYLPEAYTITNLKDVNLIPIFLHMSIFLRSLALWSCICYNINLYPVIASFSILCFQVIFRHQYENDSFSNGLAFNLPNNILNKEAGIEDIKD